MPDILNSVELPTEYGLEDIFTFCFVSDPALSIYRLDGSVIVEDTEERIAVHATEWGAGSHIPVAGLSHEDLLDAGTYGHDVIESTYATLAGVQDTLSNNYSQHLLDYHTVIVDTGAVLQSSWINYGIGFANFSVKRINRQVFIEGRIKGGIFVDGTILFTCSSGWRPPTSIIRRGQVSGGSFAELVLRSDGVVKVFDCVSNESLGFGISFLL